MTHSRNEYAAAMSAQQQLAASVMHPRKATGLFTKLDPWRVHAVAGGLTLLHGFYEAIRIACYILGRRTLPGPEADWTLPLFVLVTCTRDTTGIILAIKHRRGLARQGPVACSLVLMALCVYFGYSELCPSSANTLGPTAMQITTRCLVISLALVGAWDSTINIRECLLQSLQVATTRAVCWLYDAIASGRQTPGQEFLSGNYAPVHDEVHVTNLTVEGAIPQELEGVYVRTGPNPMLKPVGGYHWFDGDGMVHGVKFSGGRACSYANHAVRTARLEQEQSAGRPLFLKGGDIFGWSGLVLLLIDHLKKRLRIIDASQVDGTANTALIYHAQRLLALHEADLPYQLRILCSGIIETLGRLNVKGQGLPAFPSHFTAHPKIDPITREMFFFGYSLKPPYVKAGLMDANGCLSKQWVIHTPYPAMMHDCGLTKNYAILLHMPLVFDPMGVAEGHFPFRFRPELGTRIGLLRRDTPGTEGDLNSVHTPQASVQWFDLPTGLVFHVANAWEDEEGLVHVITCHFPEFNFPDANAKDKPPPRGSGLQQLTEYLLDPRSGKTANVTTLSPLKGVDFPVVHPSKTAYPNRYVWCATVEDNGQTADVTGIVKFDLSHAAGEDACVARIAYPRGCHGGEACFVPRTMGCSTTAAEDDGWLLVYVHDNTTQQSSLNIYDARTMDPTPLARVIMPQRVPFGFHGTFVTQEQLSAQQA